MSHNIKDNIIQKSWDIIHEDSKIKNFYFFPGLISIVFFTFILVYQTIYTYVEIFQQEDKALRIILELFHSDYIFEILIGFGIFLLFYILLMPFYESTLITYISKKDTSENEVSISDSIGNGLYRYLPIFEFGNIFSQFKFMSVVNIYLFCLRFIGIEYITFLSIIFSFLLFFSTIVNILFAYARFEIVLNGKKAMDSITESIKISILNISSTTKLYFYMFLLNVRILINFIVFLIFPFFIATAIAYITTKVFLVITVILLSIIFFVLVIILGYMGGVLDILKTSIRYYAYVEGKKKLAESGHDDHGHGHDDGHDHDEHGHDEHHH